MKVHGILYDSGIFLYNHLPFVIVILAGLVIMLIGLALNSSHRPALKLNYEKITLYLASITRIMDKVTSFFPLRWMKKDIVSSLSITLIEENVILLVSSFITLIISLVSMLLAFLLHRVGQLWYVKILLTGMSIILPYYIATLFLDMYRYYISKAIPKLIDEFRSSFIRHNKIRPALKECSLYIDKGLGGIIARASDSTFIEKSLDTLKQRFDNVWFNIYVALLLNYKENGGELID